MLNPLDNRELPADAETYINQLRTIRANARKAARSGNPAKREPALRVLPKISPAIAAVYRKEMSR